MAAHLLGFPAAFLLDLVLGDPRWLPHPIRWMGSLISAAEPRFRRLPVSQRAAGALFTAALVLGTFAVGCAVVQLAGFLHPTLGFLAEVLILFYCLSVRSLGDAAEAVHTCLARDDLPGARKALSMIVGRETDRLDPGAVARAVVETVSENLVDGVLAPLFFAGLGGVPLALAYKMVNTLDSMVGYKNDRYREFGWASARLDDAAAFLPARLSLPIIAAAGQILKKRGRAAMSTGLQDGRLHTSPNAGLPEAAFAGVLAVRLGGPNSYHGRVVEKPWIGETFPEAVSAHIPQAVDLMVLSSGLGFALFWLIRILIVGI